MVAFPTTARVTYIVGDLDPADQHIRFTISDIESPSKAACRWWARGSSAAQANASRYTMPNPSPRPARQDEHTRKPEVIGLFILFDESGEHHANSHAELGCFGLRTGPGRCRRPSRGR